MIANGLNESYYRESSWKTLTNALYVANAIKVIVKVKQLRR